MAWARNAEMSELYSATSLVRREGLSPNPPPERMDQSIDPILPHCQVENATAPSAGCSPDPGGEGGLGKRIPFPIHPVHFKG